MSAANTIDFSPKLNAFPWKIIIIFLVIAVSVIYISQIMNSRSIDVPKDIVIDIPVTNVNVPVFLFKGMNMIDARSISLALGNPLNADNGSEFYLTKCLSQAYLDATTIYTDIIGVTTPCEGYLIIVLVHPSGISMVNGCDVTYVGNIISLYVLPVMSEGSMTTLVEQVMQYMQRALMLN